MKTIHVFCFIHFNGGVSVRILYHIADKIQYFFLCRVDIAYLIAQCQAEPNDWSHHRNMEHTSENVFRRTNEAVPLKMFLSTIAFDTFKYQTETH